MKSVTWFDGESGRAIVRVPDQAVRECSHPGPCEDDVAAWVDRVEWLAGPEDIRQDLRGYGAWDDDELADDDANRRRALWIAAGDIRENPEQYAS